jgi:nucleoside 2-deoxyribosyltransferase
MRIYIATSLDNVAQHNKLRDSLDARHELTYDWTAHGSVQHLGEDVIRSVAYKEARGVSDADLVVILLPGGRGTHVELGIAIGAEVPVYIYNFRAYPKWCAFYLSAGVRLFDADEWDYMVEQINKRHHP